MQQYMESAMTGIPQKRYAKHFTKQRKQNDFTNFVRQLIDQYYRKTKKVVLVLDNLNTHFAASFYETFTRAEIRRILKKIDFCYTPKHCSWLNMAEIEINISKL